MSKSSKFKITVSIVLGAVVLGAVMFKKLKPENRVEGRREKVGESTTTISSSNPKDPSSSNPKDPSSSNPKDPSSSNPIDANSEIANSGASPVASTKQGQVNATGTPSESSSSGDETAAKPDASAHRQEARNTAGNESMGPQGGKAPEILPSENERNSSSANGKPLLNLKSGSSPNEGNLAGGRQGQTVATTTPSKTTVDAATNRAAAPVTAPKKERPNFPGIIQSENGVMVSDVNYRAGEGEDSIIVTLTQVHGADKRSGKLWVIGEYVQRGTTGIMFMPSHKDLKLASDGTPSNPKIGTAYQLTTVVKTSVTVRKPGFEGEELVGVRIGVLDGASGEVHYAKISMKHIQKRPVIKRIKVSADEVKK
jgi:hypothetical protein